MVPASATLGGDDLIGQRASDTSAVAFEDVVVPADHLVGEEGRGFQLALASLEPHVDRCGGAGHGPRPGGTRVSPSTTPTSASNSGVPIAEHQAVQLLLADMATKVHLARLATVRSAELVDRGESNTLESSHAKRFAADVAMEVTTDAVQIFGGNGLRRDHPVEKLMRMPSPSRSTRGPPRSSDW